MPEFELFARCFSDHGVKAHVLAPSDVVFSEGRLRARSDGSPIDLVYNRLTDFKLESPELAAIAHAYEARAITLTPNPRAHALFADKARLITLSDENARGLLVVGRSESMRASRRTGDKLTHYRRLGRRAAHGHEPEHHLGCRKRA